MRQLLSLCLIISFVVFAGCKQPQSFVYRDLKNFKLSTFGMDQAKASMDLVFFNPNKYGVNLKNVNCEVYLDSLYIGKLALDTSLQIPGASEFTLPASMEVDPRKILNSGLNLLLNNEVTVGAKGTTKVGKAGVFVTIPFTYEGRHKINLF